MAITIPIRVPVRLLLLFICLCSAAAAETESLAAPKTYIVHVSESQKPSTFSSHRAWYSSILQSLPSNSPNGNSTTSTRQIIYAYERAVCGFAARLTAAQVAELRKVAGVIAVLPDETLQIQTTHSPTFLRLSDTDTSGLWRVSNYGEDIIIGVLDTGIYNDAHPSFSDAGLSAVPSSWRGQCQTGTDFPASFCNRKVIGARAFYGGVQSQARTARDTVGHGTHVASTAAGAAVAGAGFYEFGVGEARGIATRSRIAVYKVCWPDIGCSQADVLAGMDQAIFDGVHVISFSISDADPNSAARPYYSDNTAIGAFGVVRSGIIFSCIAGNMGPGPSTARNLAPWMLTVGASTMNRMFAAQIVLGNGVRFTGATIYNYRYPGTSNSALVYAGDSGTGTGDCGRNTLNPSIVQAKIVICDRHPGISAVEQGNTVQLAGGVGMIVVSTDGGISSEAYLLPAIMVTRSDGDSIKSYVRAHPSPTAAFLFLGTQIVNSPPAPMVASFSGRGPNQITPEILKPDVVAPGVDILAAWTGDHGPSSWASDPRRVRFNVISGTSMACPHVSGLAAMLRKRYPTWSPAAIKSALMTTAYVSDNSGSSIKDASTGLVATPFLHGSGHVDPTKVLDPGLVYDMGERDYVAFLCSIGYTQQQILLFLRGSGQVDCRTQSLASPGDLNYPSFSVVFSPSTRVVTYRRTVRNVGNVNAVYTVSRSLPNGVTVSFSSERLAFNQQNNVLSYEVTFTNVGLTSEGSGHLQWSDGTHIVRSPIAFTVSSTASVASV